MSRILYLCHRLPYAPDKGCRVRAFHHLQSLARRHEVRLLSFAETARDARRADTLKGFCAGVEIFVLPPALAYLRCALGAWRRRPLTHGFFASRPLRRRVRELVGEVDGVVAFSSAMAPYASDFVEVPRLLDMVDVDSEKWRQYAKDGPLAMRPAYALEGRRLRRWERQAPGAFDHVTLATDRETDLLRDLAGGATNVSTVRNGVDGDFFGLEAGARARRPTIIFAGQMDYYPNVDAVLQFVRHALPALRSAFPELELLVVGRSPSRAVQALVGETGVTVTGEVPDVRPFLARAWVSVAPLRIARGVQNKVLEAMACAVPVVCSRAVFAGLADGGFREGRDLLVADDDLRLVHHVTRLLESAEERRRLAQNAGRQLLAAYSWANSGARIEELLLGERGAMATGKQEQPAGA